MLEQATIAHPSNKALLAGYGRALADNGNFQQAFDVLGRAHTPDDPDWRILSAQGAVLDQLGRYEEARQYYASALKIVPEEPSVLSNLGLSYVLSKDLPKAEETLRRANSRADADPRVRPNLALVVGLQGRMAEAESIVKADRPPEEAAANVADLRRLLSRKDNAHAEADKTAGGRDRGVPTDLDGRGGGVRYGARQAVQRAYDSRRRLPRKLPDDRRQERAARLLGLAAAGQPLRDLQKHLGGAVAGGDLRDHLAVIGGGAEHSRVERNGRDRLALDGLGESARRRFPAASACRPG